VKGRNDQENTVVYEFGEYRLDTAKRVVLNRKDESIPLKSKAFDTLLYLLENPGRLVERDELLSAVWVDTVVEENNLTQHISSLRKLFGEAPGDHRYILTIPGRGYKFIADVRRIDIEPQEPLATTPSATIEPAERERPRRILLLALSAVVLLTLMSMGVYWWAERPSDGAGEIRSIAVLPFKPLTADKRDESLELGMSDSLINKLVGSKGLTVRPLATVRTFGSPEIDPVEAGRKLGVEAVLDGYVQIADDRVRVSATLFRVSDSKQLWAGQFDEKLTHIFVVQDSISERVAAALRIELGEKGRKRYTESVEAYQLYMNGQLHASRLVKPEVEKGIEFFQRAIEVDAKYAVAYVGIVDSKRALVLTNDAAPKETMEEAKTAALRAVEIDPSLSEAHAALGGIAFWYDWDWKASEKHFVRAIDLDPESRVAHLGYAHLLSNVGRHDEALTEVRRARAIDPVSPITNALEGQILTFAGRNDEALAVLKRTIEIEPNLWLAFLFMSRVYFNQGNYPEMISTLSEASEMTKGNAEALGTLAFAYGRSGASERARAIRTELEQRAKEKYVPSYALAAAAEGIGDREAALDLLEKAHAEKEPLIVFLKVEPKWNDLREEPRFVELMRKMNFEQQ
jgi:serine/threonine-protein kinase